MALFPKIQSPCPFKSNLASVMDGDFCRACKRTVTDLTAMSDAERVAFLGACTDEKVCVTYRLPAFAAAAAMGATLVAASPAAATDMITEVVITGGVHPAQAAFVQHAEAPQAATPAAEIPVVYDDKTAPAAKPADAKTPASRPSK